MARKKTPKAVSEEEKSLFRDAMEGVRKLATPDTVEHPRKKPRIRFTEEFESSGNAFALQDNIPQVDNEESLFYQCGSIQQNQIKKLKRGQIDVEADLDLHGFTREQAALELSEFINACVNHGLRYVRVIHGKGYRSSDNTGVLKSAVNQWLQQSEHVLAFSSAPPRDGGTGAVNILLRKG